MKRKIIIELSAAEVEKMTKDLSLLVVSMDRIGSTDFADSRQRHMEMGKYFEEVKAFRILAGIRRILDEAYDIQSDKSDVSRLEEDAEILPYWHLKTTE